MTTQENDAGAKLDRLTANLARVEELTERLVNGLAKKKAHDAALNGPSNDVYVKAAAAYLAEMMQNPAKILEHQIGYWGKSLRHYVEAQKALASGELKAPEDATPKDRRFSNPLWETHPYFNFIKQQYMINS